MGSEFKDIFDVDHFITSLRDEVRILKEVPPRLKRRVELGVYHTMPPISWSNMSYYQDQVLLSRLLLHSLSIILEWFLIAFLENRFFPW